MFMGDEKTHKECLEKSLFGLHKKDLPAMERIRPTSKLFLLNFSRRVIYGPFCCASEAAFNLVPEAWQKTAGKGNGKGKARKDDESPFPAQIRICRKGRARSMSTPRDVKYDPGPLTLADERLPVELTRMVASYLDL